MAISFTADTEAIDTSGNDDDSFKWIVAWLVTIVLLVAFNRTRIGHVIIYYSLWLMLTFLLVSQANAIARLLMPLGSEAP